MYFEYEFHKVAYEPTMRGPGDSSSDIARDFADDSKQTSQPLSAASKALSEAAQGLAQAIGGGATFEEIEDLQEGYRRAAEEFDGLHRKWTSQATSALSVFRRYWTSDQDRD
ncbi:hypothetical protein [Streptomyces sp. NBC_01187]|uniref:hypothetical protein n=1 Tax=Streptomyces sp. NBC_01187 TaxID=2903766 RepID=UPI003869A852|nr:hypothetical protein OG220_11470 [Streptomyces sp. NBC_01187]